MSEPERPDPDLLLRQVEREEDDGHGRLRVYLGAAPGVGKTYAMLQEGKRRLQLGTDVVVGFVETYGRPLTVEALEGLEVIPRRLIEYRGVTLEEMDTDAIIARHPQVALVDELAHTNAPGSKHEKRWQDAFEILDAGITVISTVNVQHLESLNDVVEGITGVHVRETVPDAVLDRADEVEVVDISPQALQSRMRHGNIYKPDQADQALRGFFREGNLTALRELVLRRVAAHVDEELDEYMREHRIEGWQTAERVLAVLDAAPASERLIRHAWRLASAFDGELFAAYPASATREQGMTRLLTVALDLNAALREVPGEDLLEEIEQLIMADGVQHLVVLTSNSPSRFGWRRVSLAEQLIARHRHLMVHSIAGD